MGDAVQAPDLDDGRVPEPLEPRGLVISPPREIGDRERASIARWFGAPKDSLEELHKSLEDLH